MNGVNGTDNVIGKTAAERSAQKLYWTEHSVETTVEAMMLDSQAKVIDKEERPEVGDCARLIAILMNSCQVLDPSRAHKLPHDPPLLALVT